MDNFSLVLKESRRQRRKRLRIRTSLGPRCCQNPGCDTLLKRNQLWHCSYKCRGAADRAWFSAINKGKAAGPRVSRERCVCELCSMVYRRLPSDRKRWSIKNGWLTNGTRLYFCSRECKKKYIGMSSKFFTYCDYCFKLILRVKNGFNGYNYSKAKKNFCSQDCHYLWMSSEENRGENHPCFVEGERGKVYCSVWDDWDFKTDLQIRDDFECKNPFCLGKSDRLILHHIDNNKKNCHPWNLITLCASCNSRAAGGLQNRVRWQMFYEVLMMSWYSHLYPHLRDKVSFDISYLLDPTEKDEKN